MTVLKDKYLQSLSNTNDFFKNRYFLERIDEKKLYALVKSTNVLLKIKKWWEDHSEIFQDGDESGNGLIELDVTMKEVLV